MMKNIFAFAFLLACWFSLHAQTKPTISNQSGATEFCQDRFYTFIANPPTDCTFSFWSFSNGQLSYQGSSTQNSPFASIKFPASGTLTANFTCGTATYDINFSAVPSSVTITPSKTNVILLETFSLSATGANYYFWTGDGMISYSGTPVTAAPENGGPDTYTVYGSMVSGSNCSASASTTVTVTKLIDVGPDKSFCRADGNIDLNSWGQSLTTGSWSGPSISNNTILIGQLSDNRYRYVYTRTSDGAQDVLYLSVSGPLAGTASITTASLCGQLTGDLSFSGGLGNLSWQRSHDSGNTWSTISGATSTSYHYSETQETWFRAVTTGPLGGCPDQFSNVVKAVVVPAQSGSISAAADPNSCLTATGNLSLQGYVGAILFWQRSTDNGNTYLTVPNSAGLVSISYNESADTYYKVAVQQGTCQAVFTSPYLVHPIVTAGGNLNSTSSTLDCGNSQANLNLNNYQGDVFTWQASTNDASWFDLQLTGPQNPVSAQTDTWYRVKVERAGFNCPASYSSEFFLQASTHPGTASTTSTEQCGTASGNLTLSNFTGTITQWERSTDNQTWQAVANSAGFPVLQFATSNPVTYYRAAVKFGTSPTCATQYSNVVQVDVSSPTVPGAVTFVGESKEAEVVNGALTFYPTFTLNSYSGLIQNWWEYFYPDVNNGQVINSHANSITVPVITTIEVRAEVKNGNCDALLSGAALMYVNAPFLGDVVDTEGTVLDSYQGYSYKVASAFGISLADGFTFMANSGQDFFIFTDDSYSLPPTDKTFVQEQTILKEGVTDPDKVYFLNAFDRSNTYSYIDGLGRPAQQVQRMASPNQNDIVVPITYDAFGRTDKDYLPFEAQSRSGNFVKNAVSAQAQFYLNPTPKVTASDYPFAAKVYEQSPLSRVTEQGAPGVDWQPVLGHTTKFKYETNIDNEVVLWKMNEATNRPENDGYYAAGTLEVNTAIDEHGSAVKQYKDKNGKLINKKAQNGDALVETVYVYDDANQLRVVMQPEGVANLSGNPDDDFLDKWAFQYRYDEFRRMSQKKVPGAGWVYMVYDNRDRLVMTQDANQRPNNQWMFTKYDDQNRPVMAGIYTFSDPTARVGIASREDIAASISTNNFFEVFDISQTFGYTTYRTFPSDNIEILSVTYYDNYDFISLFGSGFDYDASQLPSTATKTDFVQGQVTGTQTKVRKTNTFLKTVNRYDNKNRIIQSIGSNHLSGFDKTSVVYDFLGRVLTKILVHTKPGDPDITVAEEFTFDHAGRLKAQYHQVGNGPKVNLKSQNYNALGQLVEKNLHLRNDGAYQQSVDYRYNIRGWLTHINNAALADDSGVTNDDGNDYFGFELRYNTPTTNGGAAQFNGNISEVLWSNLVSGRQSYAYSYDPLNRLTQAKYFDTNNPLNNNRFNEQITGYDRNGNIIGTTRQGKTGEVAFSNTYGAMDNLGYSYQGNKLFRVDDSANSTSEEDGFKELNTSSDDYEYDDNGNLTKDKNKGISSMTYNYMNLVDQVVSDNGATISYTYDHNGIRLKQEYVDNNGNPQKAIDFVGSFVYENNSLSLINHDEGQIKMNSDGPEYQYALKDNVKNTRVLFTSRDQTDSNLATFEDESEQNQFINFEGIRRINSSLFDHTHIVNGSGGLEEFSERLSGSENEKIGLARSMRVAPGDIINLEVFAKYVDPNANDLTPDLANLLSQISSGSASSVIDGAGYLDNLASTFPFLGLLNTGGEVSDAPKAYLNWLVFDKNFVFKTGGFVRISDKAKENGSNVTHEKLVSPPIAITEPGYFYTYLSNEEDTPVEVFFDDFKVSQIKSHLLQSDDYYPLGLSISSTAFDRDNENYKGQVTTEGLGTKDLGFRSLDPAIGRFQAVDPLAEIQITESPYQFAGNNSISSIDLFGLIGDEIDENDVWDSIEKIADEKMAQKDGDTYEMSQVRQLPSRQKSKSADLSETETSEQELMSSSRNESGDIFGANDVAKGRGRKRGKRTHWWNGYSLYKGKKSRKSSGSSSSSSDGDWFDLVAGREIQNAGGLDKPDHRLDLTALSRASDFLGDYTHDQFTGANERNTDDIVDLLIGRSYKRAQTETNFQELKRYFLTNHPGNEARALLASAKGGISDFSFLADLERNVTSITMTSTSDDAFGNEEKVLTRGELQSDPRFRPLTTQAMRDKAKEQCPTCEQWKVNVIAGNALEYAWNRMSGISRNFSNKFSNDVRSKNVRPDFVFTKTEHTTKDNGEPDLFKYDKGVFVEVKASQNTLDKSAFNNQLWAELNALSKQKGSGLSDWSFGVLGKNAPDGVLTYLLVVTEGTIVSNDLIEEATSLGISFFISYTYENVQTGGVVFSAPERMNTFGSATGEGSQIEEIVNIKAPQTGVQLEMDRANFFLTRSNEYDETQP